MNLQITNSNNYPELFEGYENVLKNYNLIYRDATIKITNTFYDGDTICSQKETENVTKFAFIEIDSLDSLAKLEKELKQLNNKIKGLIFSTSNDKGYCIEIYDNYIE